MALPPPGPPAPSPLRRLPFWRGILALVVSLLGLYGIGLLGEVRIPKADPFGYLRVSFRFRPPLIHQCRAPFPGELDHLPLHMRPKEICMRGFVPYHLKVEVDGAERISLALSPKGAQHDRPIGVDELLPLPPGEHRVRLQLHPLSGDYPSYAYATTVTLERAEVAIITLKDDREFRLLTHKEGGYTHGERYP